MPILEQVLEKNHGKVKLVFKNFPLRSHKYAGQAARAALAAAMQGKFWEFHNQLFLNYKSLNDQKISDIARDLGFDADKFDKQTADSRIVSQIRRDIQDGIQAGVKSVPAIFVNGRLLRNRTLKDLQVLIDKELEKLKP